MAKTINYFIINMKQIIRSIEKSSYVIFSPFILIISLAFMFGGGDYTDILIQQERVLHIGVINKDQTQFLDEWRDTFESYLDNTLFSNDPLQIGFGNVFIKNINTSNNLLTTNEPVSFKIHEYQNNDEANTAIKKRLIALYLIIPANFSQTILAGLHHKVNVTNQITLTNESQFIRSEATFNLIGDYSFTKFTQAQSVIIEMLDSFLFVYTGLESAGGNLKVKEVSIISEELSVFDKYIPGILVLVLLLGNSAIVGVLAQERTSGTIDRLKLSNFSQKNLIFGLSLTQLVIGLIQIIISLLTIYLIGFPGTGNLFYVLIICFLLLIPLIGIGLIVAAYTEGPIATGMAGMNAIILSFFTGEFIPLPRWQLIQEIQVWHLLPVFSASEAMRKILFLNYDLTQVLMEIMFSFIIGIIIFLIGLFAFQKKIYSEN
ncbi:MAG: ABC transporter permease [Candidatus Hodarchaeales archaeon]|jgi:ABC-type polysaccharide/polyol phosphate export permease